jgi:outer membrane protein TolC
MTMSRSVGNMKRLKNTIIVLLLMAANPFQVFSQTGLDSVFVLPDTAKVFTLENLYTLILKYHPVVKQVDLMTEVARQEIRFARGSFDPKIEASLVEKNLRDTEYYHVANAELKVPTRFPLDPKVGIDKNKGTYLNPERYISPDYNYQQFYAGISLPIGRGLFTDDRRTTLRQAELFTQSTEAEQIKLINKLLLDAAKDYWDWYFAYYNYRLYDRSVRIARDIFRRVKVNADFGELAPIDTVQAKLTWQERLVEQQEAWLDFRNSGLKLSNYLWDSLNSPLELEPSWAPADHTDQSLLDTVTLQELLQRSRENHPELQKIRIRLLHHELDRKLAVENLKPRLDLNYNFINQPLNPEGGVVMPTGNDYKFGVDFAFPVFLRKERAKLAFARLKISDTRYEERLLSLQISNEIQGAYNGLVNNQLVLGQQTDMAENYNRLLQAEFINLENGESDLFRLNVQQEKFLQAQSKVLKIRAELEKQKALLLWAAGIRNLGR